jgi:hypothetical protein
MRPTLSIVTPALNEMAESDEPADPAQRPTGWVDGLPSAQRALEPRA